MINFQIDLKKNQPQVIMLAVLVALITFILYLYLFFLPQVGRLTNLLSKTGKTMADLKTAQTDIAKIDGLRKDIGTYKEKVDIYEKRLPAEQEIPALLESLSSMAKRSNIIIVGITPITPGSPKDQKETKGRIYQEFPILISAKSGYHELGSFLNNLENADRFIKVVDIEMKSNKANPKKHDVELIVFTYILLSGK